MPADGVLNVGTQVNLGPLRAGMAEAQAAVEAAGKNMAEAQMDARRASADLASALKQLGPAAAAGSKQAKEVLLEAQDAVNIAKERVRELTSAYRDAAEAVGSLGGAEREETQSLRTNISARMAASAELQILRGNLQSSTRAAGAFLSSLPGVGAAMQAAFAPFALVALVGLLSEAAEKVGSLMTAFENLDGAEIKATNDAIIAGEKILKIKAGHFDMNAFVRFAEGAPTQPDITVQNAATKLKEIQQARELADARAGVNEQGKTGVALQQQKIADAQKDIDYAKDAKTAADALVDSYKKQLEAKITVSEARFDPKSGMLSPARQINAVTDPNQVKAIQDQLKTAATAAHDFNHEIEMMKVKLHGAEMKLPLVDDSAANKAAQEKLKGFETAFDTERIAQTQNVFSERSFWAAKLDVFKEGSDQYREVLGKVAELTERMHQQEAESLKKYRDEQKTDADKQFVVMGEANKAVAKFVTAQNDAVLHIGKLFDDEYLKNLEDGRRRIQSATEAMDRFAQFRVQMGQITPQQAIKQERYAEEDRYNTESNALYDAQDKLQGSLNSQQGMDKDDPGYDPTLPQKIQQINSQIESLEQQHSQRMEQLEQRSALLTRKAWDDVFKKFNSDFTETVNKVVQGTQSMSKAFADLARQIEMQLIDAAIMKVLTLAENAMGLGGGANNKNQQQLSLDRSINPQIVESNSAAAASVAFLTSGGNLAAALTTYAEGMTFAPLAAFDKGTSLVPRDGMAMLHANESVLPPPQTAELRNALGRGKGSRGGGALNVSPTYNINGHDHQNFKSMLRAHTDELVDIVRGAYRGGKLTA